MNDSFGSPRPDGRFGRNDLPEQIAHYRLETEIGAGSFSRVFLAKDVRSEQRVALKLLTSAQLNTGLGGGDAHDRFEIERRALAQMNSDYVAKLFDSGHADGRHYFVMEYVDGLPLTTFCDGRRMSIAQRVELFRKVCKGVLHIHQRSVIHRDLKPENVLVAELDGCFVPKIVDLGLARGVDRLLHVEHIPTAPGTALGTLGFMAPEQAGADRDRHQPLDTRADVYSLGALLYVLLAGELPIGDSELSGLGLAEQVQRLLDADPKPPSRKLLELEDKAPERAAAIAANRGVTVPQLIGALIGDLDWIVMKAMERERHRRYESVEGLGLDLEDYLELRPVSARPPSPAYSLRKFLRRNRVAVRVVAALLVAMVALTGMAVRGWYQANQNAALIQQNLDLAEAETRAAKANERLARERAEEALARRKATAETLLTVAEAAAARGDFPRALESYDEAAASGVVDERRLAVLRVKALDGARRYPEAVALLATIPGAENDAQLQLLRADLGVDRLRAAQDSAPAARRALELDEFSGELTPADRLYARAIVSEDPLEVLDLLREARSHDAYHRRVNDCFGTTLLLMGRLEEAVAFRAVLKAMYPDDPQTWFFSLAIAGIRGDEDMADGLLKRIKRRFGDEDARLAELIYNACALAPFANEKMRESLENPHEADLTTPLRLVGAILPLKRAIDDMLPEQGTAAAGVAFIRTPPAIVNTYRPLWEALEGQGGGRMITALKAAFAHVNDNAVEGSVPMVYAGLMLLQGQRERCMAALRQSLSLPAGIFERRTILVQGLLVSAALLADDEFTADQRDEFAQEVRTWVDEACQLPDKSAGECYVIYHAAYRVRSERLAELVSCWNRLAPEAPSARLAFAEQQYFLGSHELALRIVASIDREKLDDWQQGWARGLREAAQRAMDEKSAAARKAEETGNAAEAAASNAGSGK